MVDLPHVTLCAISSANIKLTQRALDLSSQRCAFGNVLFLPNQGADYSFRNITHSINTPFVLFAQWDGYVLDASAWSDEFLEYDYIGAKWPWHTDGMTVGNSGFCLRSKKLLDVMAREDIPLPGVIAEDNHLCRVLRPMLERQHGIRFAPEAVADKFAYERAQPHGKTFGFHGMFNMWRHLDYSEVPAFIELVDDYVIDSLAYRELMGAYQRMGRFDLVEIMQRRKSP